MTHIANKQQLLRSILSGWLSLAAEIVIAFILTPYIIFKLGAATYGVWSLMISVIGYLGLIDIGIRGSVGRYINHYLARNDHRALNEVVGTSTVVLSVLSLLAAIAAYFLGDNFSTIFPKTPADLSQDIRLALPLLAVGLWLSFISSILSNLLAAKEALYLTNGYNLLVLLVRSAAIYWALGRGYGIDALVVITLGSSLLGVLLSLWSVRSAFADEKLDFFLFSAERLKKIWRYGLAAFVGRSASTMANDSAPIIGMWILGPEAVAVYSVAMMLTQNARRVLDQTSNAIFPSVMKAGAIKDLVGLRGLYIRFMDISFAIGALVFLGLTFFAGNFLELWVGVQYREGSSAVAILALGYLLGSIASTGPLSLASLDHVNTTMRISLAEAILCIVLTSLLPGFFGLGLAGMALGSTLPRLLTGCALYPWLSISYLGNELRQAIRESLIRNLFFVTLIASCFWIIAILLPSPSSWTQFFVAVFLATLSHLLIVASRYRDLPMIGFITNRTRKLLPWINKF
jgi:O-antigen/teichoic acid export membrane protein